MQTQSSKVSHSRIAMSNLEPMWASHATRQGSNSRRGIDIWQEYDDDEE